MQRLKNYKNILVPGMEPLSQEVPKDAQRLCASLGLRVLVVQILFLSSWFTTLAQRQEISLNTNWKTSLIDSNKWKTVNIPHNWDDYYGYRRLLHGNLHGSAIYTKTFKIKEDKKGKQFFLFFEAVGSYATVYLNNKVVGTHAGGRTTFTLNVTNDIKTDGSENTIKVQADHPANIKDLPWVCGGCSDERGFSEGSQPLGIFRPVHLVITNDVRISPFGIHAWAEIKKPDADLFLTATIKNYSAQSKTLTLVHQLIDANNQVVVSTENAQKVSAGDSIVITQKPVAIADPKLWSPGDPYLYKIVSIIKENNIVLDKVVTNFGFRTADWSAASGQFLLNGKPIFINGIAEYEHLIGQSHAFSDEEITSRVKWVKAAGFNAFRDGHQPHNLLYSELCNERGILWWTQLSAHIWYDTKVFRDNFKTLLRDWVIERRNDPSVILWGIQNESKLPKDFAEECTAIIRELDPTASTQRLVTTCNGGEGTDWDVPQNWTGTYGGDPNTYASDIKKQRLIGEYGAWRTLDLHTEGGFDQNGIMSEDRMTQLMEQKVRLAESVKDSVAGQFFWLLTSHDNPGRVQGGEGLRELDRIGPVNYKGLLTPWEEPTDAFYMFRSNYAPKETEPMVYIVSHTWPNRWMQPGFKDSIYIYSNCDEVELFNDIDGASLGRKKRNGIGTHFQWDHANIQYNVLFAVGYVNGKAVAKDTVVLFHLPQAPNYDRLYAEAKNLTSAPGKSHYVYRINCGGSTYKDQNNYVWTPGKYFVRSWGNYFKNIQPEFASQRRTFSPIKNTKDWELFQSFRYGRDKLTYQFKLRDGAYNVELYFIEPWLGVGGGIDATGMRLFDVAFNGKTVLKDLDIWKEVGTNTVLKKTIKVNVTGGKLLISFPETLAGQALISAIAISTHERPNFPVVATGSGKTTRSWLDIGDKQFARAKIAINTLPPNLFSADFYQLDSLNQTKTFATKFTEEADFYLAIREHSPDTAIVAGFENTHTKIITDENGGTRFNVYKTRFEKGAEITLEINKNVIMAMQPANRMQPAYDLKPNVSLRPATAVKIGTKAKDATVNGRETIVFTGDKQGLEWPINIGAADIYSFTLRYSNETGIDRNGTIAIVAADGKVMKSDNITFTQSRAGKWSYITVNTGSMINAGNYKVRITAENAAGVGVSGLDVQ